MTKDKLLLIDDIKSIMYDCDIETLNAIYTLIQKGKERSASDGLRKSYIRALEECQSESSYISI